MSVWDLALQLEAYRTGRAVPRVGCRYQAVTDTARVFCPLPMAGWDPSLQAVAIGPRGLRPETVYCVDPREWDMQLEAFSRLAAIMHRWFLACYDDGEGELVPQLILPNAAAAKLLVGLSYRLAWLAVPEQGSRDMRRWSEDARNLGRMLLFFAQQMEVPGQQSVIVASQLLSRHYAIGQQATDHLGAQLCWIDGVDDVLVAAMEAERVPLGRTTPEFDEDLEKKIKEFLKVRKGSASLASARRMPIEDMVSLEVLGPIVDLVERSLTAVERLGLPELPALEQLRQRDLRAFHGHMRHLERGGFFSKVDKPRAAVRGLTILEDATEQWGRAAVWGDPVALARARFDGEVLHGTVIRPDEHSIVVRSAQRMLKLRRGDELALMSDPDVEMLVESLARDGEHTVVCGSVTVPSQSLPDGTVVDFAADPPAWHMLGISLGKVLRRLAAQPETHRPAGGPVVHVPAMTDAFNPDQTLAQFKR